MRSAPKSRRRRLGVADSRFTYAIGKIVLWSKTRVVTSDEALKPAKFPRSRSPIRPRRPMERRPSNAEGHEVYDALQTKIVQGNSIGQAYQFVVTGNAELGFVALAQLVGDR